MKRFFLPLILASLACSLPGLASRPTPIPLIFPTAIPETITPSAGWGSDSTPTQDLSVVDLASITPEAISTTGTLEPATIEKITFSAEQFYYGGSCAPKDVTFNVKVAQPERVFSVILFVRLRDIKKENQTIWNDGMAMNAQGNGQYVFRVKAVNLPSYKEFDQSWLQYQFVLTNTQGQVIGRSEVFNNKIKLSRSCP